MAYSFGVQHHESFQDLSGDLPAVRHRELAALDILAQIPVLNVLHGEKYVGLVLIPAKKFNKQVSMLYV